jgi:hypothetical protein
MHELRYDVLLLLSLIWQTSSLIEQIWVGSHRRTCTFPMWSRRQRSKWMRKEQQPLQPQVLLSAVSRTTTSAYKGKTYCKGMLTAACVTIYRMAHGMLTCLLTPWSRVLREKLTDLQLVKKFSAFYGTRRVLTALTSARHLSLSRDSPIQSSHPHRTSWRSILILSSHLRLGLFPLGFPTKILYTHLPSPIRATCPAHLILLDFITRTILGKEYRPFSSSLCNFLHSRTGC